MKDWNFQEGWEDSYSIHLKFSGVLHFNTSCRPSSVYVSSVSEFIMTSLGIPRTLYFVASSSWNRGRVDEDYQSFCTKIRVQSNWCKQCLSPNETRALFLLYGLNHDHDHCYFWFFLRTWHVAIVILSSAGYLSARSSVFPRGLNRNNPCFHWEIVNRRFVESYYWLDWMEEKKPTACFSMS